MKHTPHAITQALERYGLKLNNDDLIRICMTCQEGYGRMAHFEDGTERHVVTYAGKRLIAIYAPYTGPEGRVKSSYGKIITFLPAHAFNPASPEYKASRRSLKRSPLRGKPSKKSRQQRGF